MEGLSLDELEKKCEECLENLGEHRYIEGYVEGIWGSRYWATIGSNPEIIAAYDTSKAILEYLKAIRKEIEKK